MKAISGNLIIKTVLAGLVMLGAALSTSSLQAHHSFAAEFDANKKIELNGVVTKVEWTNPHIWIYMNVKDAETGKVTNWGVELGPPHLLQRRGWRRNTLTIGTQIVVDGFLARNGSPRVNASSVTLANGGEVGQTLDAGSSQLDRNNEEN